MGNDLPIIGLVFPLLAYFSFQVFRLVLPRPAARPAAQPGVGRLQWQCGCGSPEEADGARAAADEELRRPPGGPAAGGYNQAAGGQPVKFKRHIHPVGRPERPETRF